MSPWDSLLFFFFYQLSHLLRGLGREAQCQGLTRCLSQDPVTLPAPTFALGERTAPPTDIPPWAQGTFLEPHCEVPTSRQTPPTCPPLDFTLRPQGYEANSSSNKALLGRLPKTTQR